MVPADEAAATVTTAVAADAAVTDRLPPTLDTPGTLGTVTA